MYKLLYDDLPNDWPVKKLNDLGVSYSGLKNKTKDDFSPLGNTKFINYKNINKNYFIDVETLENVHVDATESQIPVKKGDVFFTGSSEIPQETGLSSVLLENLNSTVFLNSFSFGFRFNNINFTSPHFFGYFFRGPIFRDKIFPLAQGSTRFNLSKNELLKLEVPVPPFKEQQKIADILSCVDNAIDKTEQIIKQTERVKQGLMQQLLTKGIGHNEFKQTEIGEIPEEWEVASFKDISTIRQGLQIPIAQRFRKSGINRYKYITVQSLDLSEDEVDYIESPRPSVICDTDDVLMTRTGNTGQVVTDVYGVFHNNFFLIDYDERILNKNFLVYYLRSYRIQNLLKNLAGTTTIPDLKHGDFYSILIPIPNLKEQKKIAMTLSNLDSKNILEKSKKHKLITLKKGLMQQLLTGKVRVPVGENEVISQ